MEKISLFVISPTALSRIILSNLYTRETDVKLLGASRPDERSYTKTANLKPDVIAVDFDPQFAGWAEYFAGLDRDSFARMIILEHEGSDPALLPESFLETAAMVGRPDKLEGEELRGFRERFLQEITLGRKKKAAAPQPEPLPKAVSSPRRQAVKRSGKLAVIGTSTGGPKALQTVLMDIPADIPAPIAIVQHMPPNFTRSLAARLDSVCQISVKEAEDGEILKIGTAYIAPGGHHFLLEETASGIKAKITDTPPVNGHRPSVDVLFSSAAHLSEFEIVSVIMTGMGSDGAKGLAQLKEEADARTIAESEETCIVYGMPKSAVQTGKVDTVAKLGDIADVMMKFLK